MGRMENLVLQVNSFLENYVEGSELKIYLSPSEKEWLQNYVDQNPNGKDFSFRPGIYKPGHLEYDFRLAKKKS